MLTRCTVSYPTLPVHYSLYKYANRNMKGSYTAQSKSTQTQLAIFVCIFSSSLNILPQAEAWKMSIKPSLDIKLLNFGAGKALVKKSASWSFVGMDNNLNNPC